MTAREIRLHEVQQLASSGSYVVIYEAHVELRDRPGVEVKICSAYPENSAIELVQMAKQAIVKGADTVLSPHGMGAAIEVRNLVINESDFKPWQLAHFTSLEFEKLAAEYLRSAPSP